MLMRAASRALRFSDVGSSPPRCILVAANTAWYIHNFRSRLIKAVLAQGYSVTIFSPIDEYVDRIKALGASYIPLELDNTSINPFRELITLVKIVSALRRASPAVILTYTPKINIYLALAARMLRIPVIANVSGLGQTFAAAGWMQELVKTLYREAFRRTTLVFFQNNEDRKLFLEAGLVRPTATARLPGSGVDVDRFHPHPLKAPASDFAFLFAGRLLWDKGIGDFVAAARRVKTKHPDVRFQILGFLDVKNPSAISREDINKWQSDGTIEYLGAKDNVIPIFAKADCVVLPSYYREGVPRTLLEAASMALPVITTDYAGCRDAVDAGVTGLLCRPRDVDDLTKRMLEMLALTTEERRAMGLAGRKKMLAQFDERMVIARYLEAIETAIRA